MHSTVLFSILRFIGSKTTAKTVPRAPQDGSKAPQDDPDPPRERRRRAKTPPRCFLRRALGSPEGRYAIRRTEQRDVLISMPLATYIGELHWQITSTIYNCKKPSAHLRHASLSTYHLSNHDACVVSWRSAAEPSRRGAPITSLSHGCYRPLALQAGARCRRREVHSFSDLPTAATKFWH